MFIINAAGLELCMTYARILRSNLHKSVINDYLCGEAVLFRLPPVNTTYRTKFNCVGGVHNRFLQNKRNEIRYTF